MIVSILVHKTFDLVAIHDDAKYLNKGDIFIPNGSGWEFRVIRKVLRVEPDGVVLNVMVRPLSYGAMKYARINRLNVEYKKNNA